MGILCGIFLLYIIHKSGVLMLVLVDLEILCSYILIVTQQDSLVYLACSAEDHNGGITDILLICY